MEWTCCNCGFKYDETTGDVDERMCFDCLEEEPDRKETDIQN